MFTQAELTMRLDRIQNKMNALEDQKVIRNMFLNDCLCFDIRLIIFNYKNKCLQTAIGWRVEQNWLMNW